MKQDFIGCAVYTINAVVAFTSGTAKVINYGSEDYDTNSFHDNSTNNSRITIPTGLGGKYNISALIRTEDSVGNLYCILGLLKNGSDFNSLGIPASVVKSDDQGTVAIVYTVQVALAAADYVEFSFNSNWATGNKTITSRFSVEYLGA